uniref:C2H2-type domain-containing protein n=1 Tax=Lygus hesperus TaxID=30085 RepID=A0A0A9YV51_LYGHE
MCDYRAARPSTLKLHVRRHTGERPYTCDICNFTCGRLEILKTHKTSTHTGEHPYACSLCSYTCVRADKLKTHQKKYHKDENTNESSSTVNVKLGASEVDERLGNGADCRLELSVETEGDCQDSTKTGDSAVTDVSVPVIKIEPGMDLDSQGTFELSGITVSNAMTDIA